MRWFIVKRSPPSLAILSKPAVSSTLRTRALLGTRNSTNPARSPVLPFQAVSFLPSTRCSGKSLGLSTLDDTATVQSTVWNRSTIGSAALSAALATALGDALAVVTTAADGGGTGPASLEQGPRATAERDSAPSTSFCIAG